MTNQQFKHVQSLSTPRIRAQVVPASNLLWIQTEAGVDTDSARALRDWLNATLPDEPSAPLDIGERAAAKAFANSPRRIEPSPTVDGSNITDELIRRLRKENELLHRALAQGRTDLTDEALGQQIRALGSAEKSSEKPGYHCGLLKADCKDEYCPTHGQDIR